MFQFYNVKCQITVAMALILKLSIEALFKPFYEEYLKNITELHSKKVLFLFLSQF